MSSTQKKELINKVLSILGISVVVFLTWYFTVNKATILVLNLLQFHYVPSDSLICVIDLIVTFVVQGASIVLCYILFKKYDLTIVAVYIFTFLAWLLVDRLLNGDYWPSWYTPLLALEFIALPIIIRMIFKSFRKN